MTTTANVIRTLICITLLLGLAGAAEAAPLYCDAACSSQSCNSDACTDPETGYIITCGTWGWYGETDCDNVFGGDNCPSHYNPNQANCDGDSLGDVCDSEDGVYQLKPGTESLCWINGYTHWFWGTYLDGHIEAIYEDVSACGSPDRYQLVTIYPDNCQFEWDEYVCCVVKSDFTGSQCYNYHDNNQCHY